jgi:hypothetical protein
MSDLGYLPVPLDASTLKAAEDAAYREREAQSSVVRHAEIETAAQRARRLGPARRIKAQWRELVDR